MSKFTPEYILRIFNEISRLNKLNRSDRFAFSLGNAAPYSLQSFKKAGPFQCSPTNIQARSSPSDSFHKIGSEVSSGVD